ncbi:MAG: nucleotidyltransferase domain-containing protein [Actinomycetota bacterium]
MEPKVDTGLDIFLNRVKKEFGQQLKEVILFGSRARGDHDEESDFDFILVFDKVTSAIKKKVSDIEAEMLCEWGMVITAFVFTEEELEMKKYEPFVMNAKKRGFFFERRVT